MRGGYCVPLQLWLVYCDPDCYCHEWVDYCLLDDTGFTQTPIFRLVRTYADWIKDVVRSTKLQVVLTSFEYETNSHVQNTLLVLVVTRSFHWVSKTIGLNKFKRKFKFYQIYEEKNSIIYQYTFFFWVEIYHYTWT